MSKNTAKGSRNFYGEYSLEQWIKLILTKEIILPDYQRAFVWSEEDVRELITSLKDGLFIPPITIGNYDGKTNYILDGQQRLSAILIAYLGLFPKKEKFKFSMSEYQGTANDNDDIAEEDEDIMPLEWQFNYFTKVGQDKQSILEKIEKDKYKTKNYDLDSNFWKDSYIGFSLIIPISDEREEQQKLYSSVFRNINIKGKSLTRLESRKSLYFLKEDFDKWFSPRFANGVTINNFPIDFVRYLSLLSQYKKNGETGRLAQYYKTKMETYYESYILAEVNKQGTMFTPLLSKDNQDRYDRLEEFLKADCFSKGFASIIDADVYLFGAIYFIIAKNKKVSITEELQSEIKEKIQGFKGNYMHSKSPSALKYLRSRIQSSIDIYRTYASDLTNSNDEA
ncbi:DUF262 domain-containing protein [Alloprevotella sp. oral taxon 473]|uniref:GmrSD restriction endonuclease domain-containing protein n=1 Tax=Alloprevotella sp. oral taxon 473 TaxID=712469 RepID=UPI0002A369EB|nr:DUF262 domain-containing protein [Alloprevotella sp. oral taxon 473]EKX92967.1 hypothetical protein HMPREF9999_00505 [Alloprevotella sp. oral taxon 473 str. F0040]